jgi:hypothetical protein
MIKTFLVTSLAVSQAAEIKFVGGKVSLDTTLDLSDKANPKVVFKTTVPSKSWFSVGFGTGMTNVDMVVWQAKDDGRTECKDLYSTGFSQPSSSET